MDIGTIASAAHTIWDTASFIFAILGFLSLAALIIGTFTRLGKAGWRFGLALFGKQIKVVANMEDYGTIHRDLIVSGLIREKNIMKVGKENLSDLQDAFMIIISCDYLTNDDFARVINGKSSRCGVIVYSPPEKGHMPPEKMSRLNSAPFSTLCNFRGRLVNDVLLMMLSTSFKKKDLKTQR